MTFQKNPAPAHFFFIRCLVLVFALLARAPGAFSEEPAKEQPDEITYDGRLDTIQKVSAQISQFYVFTDLRAPLVSFIEEKVKAGGYDEITSREDFASGVTADLFELSHDKHLRLLYEPVSGAESHEEPGTSREEMFRLYYRQAAFENYTFSEAKILPGNVGYLTWSYFYDLNIMADKFAAAMAFLGDTDALIIDLRGNHGGWGDSANYILSYFFDKELHYANSYDTTTDETEQLKTYAVVKGTKYQETKPVYVLTDGETFSAGESVAFFLQKFGRAKVVGETTRGGANWGDFKRISDDFMVFVPTGTIRDTKTNQNWEGQGVVPDIPAPANKGLTMAHKLALEALLAKEPDEDIKKQVAAALEALGANENPGF